MGEDLDGGVPFASFQRCGPGATLPIELPILHLHVSLGHSVNHVWSSFRLNGLQLALGTQ